MTNQHDLLRVPKSSCDTCSGDNAIGNVISTGPANITLDSTGEHYYICTFGSHCKVGQKLAITVSGTPGANPPTSTPPITPTTPSPTSSQPDACAPTPSSTPNAGGPTASVKPPAGIPPAPDSSSTYVFASLLPVLLSIGAASVISEGNKIRSIHDRLRWMNREKSVKGIPLVDRSSVMNRTETEKWRTDGSGEV
ncbi:unnamed protein product [Fraxinus pennsylvanica]|uniref:Phytocyanin domain-containing protein n=1 Tax=Fraxinus pennsylvanica TaxID=56036 RepID=A0AAD2AEL0_9LAMI|nr:unnamed protein product [Fraxinus pennsylvanica]